MRDGSGEYRKLHAGKLLERVSLYGHRQGLFSFSVGSLPIVDVEP